MHISTLSLVAALSTIIAPAVAQTWTSCNPMNTTCPNDPALGMSYDFVFNSTTNTAKAWNITSGSLDYGTNGAEFTINKQGDSPTIESQFYIMFGSVSVIMRAASGQGIISSMVLESDDLDEVDWEFMGGNSSQVETNYFGKGNTTSYDRAKYYYVDDTQNNFHNYTVDWTSDRIQWYVDGNLIRTLEYADANGGYDFPQTPMTVRLGIWAGGDPTNSKGTIEWAGGETDFSAGPYTMYIKSSQITDYSSGKEYEWTDKTGSWESIKAIAGNSTIYEKLTAVDTPEKSVTQKFNELSSGTKLAIYCGGGGAAALLISGMLFACIRQRRAGRKERDAYNAQVERDRENAYREQMELREKGLGGWDSPGTGPVGEDTLGGWQNTHHSEKDDLSPIMPKFPGQASVNEVPSRSRTPGAGMGVDRGMSSSPVIASPIPQSPRQWNGGNAGGLISNAGNAYSGGYGGNRSPQDHGFNFQQEPGWPSPQTYHGGGGFSRSHQGYQQF